MTPIFRSLYLPDPRLSVTNLVKFSLPPMAPSIAEYTVPTGHSFFSRDANHADIDLLRTVKVPPPNVIGPLILESRQQWLDGAESINLPGSLDLFPLWALDLWSEYQTVVKPQRDEWAEAIAWLRRPDLAAHQKEVKDTLHALSRLPWSGNIPYLTKERGNPVNFLARFLSREWFSSRQIDQMTDLILWDIKEAVPSRDVRLMDTIMTTEIMKQYELSKAENTHTYDPTNDKKWLQRFGQSIEIGTELLGIFHIHENHWVSATMDVVEEAIGYGDPMGHGIEGSDVCLALQWFAERHHIFVTGTPAPEALLCTRQEDGWNCGLYAPNALAHKYLPDKYPLISSDLVDGDLGRMRMFCRIIQRFHERSPPSAKALPSIITQDFYEYATTPLSQRHSRSPSPVTPPPVDTLSRAMDHLSVSPKKRPQKRRKIKADPSDDESVIPFAPIFKKVPAKKSVTKAVDRAKKAAAKPSAKVKKELKAQAWAKHKDEALAAMPSDVSDQEGEGSAPGRPRSDTMDQLTVEVKSSGPTRKYRCAGPGCTKIFYPRSKMRVLRHTKRCTMLTSKQRQFASKCSADTSPGARAEELSKGLSAAQLEAPVQEPIEFFGSAATKQMRERNGALMDLAIVKFYAAAGLPARLADYDEWKEIFRLAPLIGPHYVPAGRTILMDNHIMSEQERVRALQISFLKTQTRLSVSCDGGDIRSGEYFYSVHASTPEGRSFIVEGFECTNISHTAEFIANMVMEAVQPIGIERFIAVSADSTGNTRGFRRIFCERVPTILDLADPNHHLSNTVKDIVQLPYFKLAIKILRGTVKYFNQSKQSKNILKQIRMKESIGRGLETIGKTRFATVTWSAISLRRNLEPISRLCTNGQVDIKKYGSYFIRDTPKYLDFQIKLNQLISVTEGAAKAIQCLEAASCNPADVYLLWLAVTAHIRAALASSMLPEDVCNEIRGIINHRWHEFFVTNPGHEAYLATFYLNPTYVNSSIFKRPNAVAPVTITIPGKTPDVPIGVRNAKTFLAVGQYLFRQGVLEVEHGIDPVLTAYKKKKTAFTTKFKAQFTAYAQGAFPFNTPLGKDHPITWWRALEGSEHGGIIAALALKFYSAVAHSMADERTASVITWMNPALRNLEKVDTIFSFAQIRGWYRDEKKQKALKDGTAKTRASARPHPEVKFYNIERDIRTIDDEREDDDDDIDADGEDSDDEFNAAVGAGPDGPGATAKVDWLDLPREIFASSSHLDLEDGEVDLDSTLLGDILADAPRSSACDSHTAGMEDAGREEDEDDEEMSFVLGPWA
ncbi:ribonuclease H-like domain-containing protein [Mycena latifolia]|nr:ribonuclease H-like domain-containing protein [Mycena latifolia]